MNLLELFRPKNAPKRAEARRAKAKRRSTLRRKPRRNDTPPRGSSVPNVPLAKV